MIMILKFKQMKFILLLNLLMLIIFSSCNSDSGSENEPRQADSLVQDTEKDEDVIDSDEEEKEAKERAKELFTQIENGEMRPSFHGFGTEPFWDLYILDGEALYVNMQSEIYETYELLDPFDLSKTNQTLRYKDAQGKEFSIVIRKEPTGDGMSDRTYPYSVRSQTEEYMKGAGEVF